MRRAIIARIALAWNAIDASNAMVIALTSERVPQAGCPQCATTVANRALLYRPYGDGVSAEPSR